MDTSEGSSQPEMVATGTLTRSLVEYQGTSMMSSTEQPWSFMEFGINMNDPPQNNYSFCDDDLPFDIPQEVQPPPPPTEPARVPQATVTVSQPSEPLSSSAGTSVNNNNDTARKKVENDISKPKVSTGSSCKQVEENVMTMSMSQLQTYCLKLKTEVKAQERRLDLMNSMVIAEQELRETIRKKRDEIKHDLTRVQEERNRFIVLNNELQREKDELQKTSVSEKLLIQQLEAKVIDLKFWNNKMEKQLKETGEHDVPKLKEEVREQKKVIKHNEKLIDEKTETIKNLRRHIDEIKSSTAGSVVETDKDKQIDELKSAFSKLQSEMIKIIMQLRKELHDAMSSKKNTLKRSPDYLSETDSEQRDDLRSVCTYRNDDYNAFGSGFMLSPASSISSVSPPLSVASVLSTNSKSNLYTGPPVSVCSALSAVNSPVKAVDEVVSLGPVSPVEPAGRPSIELPDLEQQPVEKEGACATVEDNMIEELAIAEEPNVVAAHVETVGNNECVQLSSSSSTSIALPSSQPRQGAEEPGVRVATTDNNQPPILMGCPSEEAKPREDNSLGGTALQSVQDLRAKTNIPTKITPKSLEPKRSPKRKKVIAKNISRSACALSESDSDLSDGPVNSKSPVKVPSPVQFPSPRAVTTRSTFSPPRTRSQSKTPSPGKRKAPMTPWCEKTRASPRKRMVDTKRTKIKHELFSSSSSSSSSSDSSSESEDDSGISNAGDSNVFSQETQSPGNSKSSPLEEEPAASLNKTQDAAAGANRRTPSEAHSVPTTFTLEDDLRMSSDDGSSDEEFSDAEGSKDLSSVKVLEPVLAVTPAVAPASTTNTSSFDAKSVAVNDAKLLPTFRPPPAKVLSPKRRLSFPSGDKSIVSQSAAAKEKMVIPDRVPTLPAIFRRQASLESVTEKRTKNRSSMEMPCESDVSPEDLHDNRAKRLRISHESSSVKTMNVVRPPVAVMSKPQTVVPIYGREKIPPVTVSRGNSANTSSGVVGGNEKRMSARERIGRSVEIVAVGSGENICDKRRLELFVKEKAEQRKAEKTQGDSKPAPSKVIQPAVRTTSPALSVTPLGQESKNSTVAGTCSGKSSAPFQRQARKVPISAKIMLPVSTNAKMNTLSGAPTTRSSVRSAGTLPARETVPSPAAARRSSTHIIPERTISTRRTPVQESPAKNMSAVPSTDSFDRNPSSSRETSHSTNPPSSVASPVARLIEPAALAQAPEVPRRSAIVSPAFTPTASTSAVSPPLAVRPPIMSPPAPYLPQPLTTSAAYNPSVTVPLQFKNISSPVANPCKSEASVIGSEILTRARQLQPQRPAQPEERKAKTASQISSENTNFHKLIFGHSSRSLSADDIAAQLKSLIAAGEEPLSPDSFVKALYFDFCESIGYYLENKIDERILINGCEKTCVTIEILKELMPHVYADIEFKAVLYFSCEVLAQPIRYAYPKNDLLNQMAVCYGTICRHFNLRDLSFRLFLTVMIYRAPQKFTFAHGLVLAYPDLWSCPFEFGSLLERCTLVGAMHGSLYTNSVYFKNLHAMIQDGIGLVLPTCSYAQSFSAFLDEFKELDFRSAMEDSARGIGMLLLQTNWSASRKLIEEHLEKLFKEWRGKQITDGVLEVFINTTIWVSELAYDPEPGFAELMSTLIRISEHLDALPPDEAAPELNRAVKDGLVKLTRLIERGPLIQSELVYYKIEDEVQVKKQLAKVTQTEKKRRKKYKKREEARKQKKLLEELAQVDT